MDAIKERGAYRADENADYVAAILKKEVDRLIKAGVPEFGTLTIIATINSGDVTKIELGAAVGRKLAARSIRSGACR